MRLAKQYLETVSEATEPKDDAKKMKSALGTEFDVFRGPRGIGLTGAVSARHWSEKAVLGRIPQDLKDKYDVELKTKIANGMRSIFVKMRMKDTKVEEASIKGFTKKAKRGDMIQSFDVAMPPDTSRGSVIGRVIDVKKDEADGVEYVHFEALVVLHQGVAEDGRGAKMRVPQNGTKTSMGRTTDGINVL